MKLSKRKITAKKIQRNRTRKLIRHFKKDVMAFGKLMFPDLMKGLPYGNLQPKDNPFIYSEGIQASHAITMRDVPRVLIYPGSFYSCRSSGRVTLKAMLTRMGLLKGMMK